ncbi:zinc finger BED domain-containing protein RICESLEEPER 3-like [Syzygium oleosum]|uniref:zinc finger BED domain-containing protein RICESLEEPER 3-like n=1 Tax=Syzygium oleosum TaxID=219896 RepID=UPI0024B89A96|nr:zinc finger BED domain-containing protein RICESLEEPER 3-like [Syzygium oleosum]
MATPEENNDVKTLETQPNKRRKKKSIIWEHFTIEIMSPGCRRACCKQCKQSFAYGTGSKAASTSQQKNTKMMENTYAPCRIMKNICMTAARQRSDSGDCPCFLVNVNIAGPLGKLVGNVKVMLQHHLACDPGRKENR